MKLDNIKVYNIMDALRGMRNPLNSWDKNDTTTSCDIVDGHILYVKIGENDMKLARRLVNGGTPHRKFLRQIDVSMDISGPVYWWAEMDTYKTATTRNSCSVQHKGSSRDFQISDLTIDGSYDFEGTKLTDEERAESLKDAQTVLDMVNKWRRRYVDGGKTNYDYFRVMRQLLPMGYNYKATFTGNYETLLNIYEWRHNHLLKEWHEFCNAIVNGCPGFKEICIEK